MSPSNSEKNKSKESRSTPSKRQIRIAAIVATKSEDMELIVPVDLWRRAHFIVDLISIEKKNSVTLSNGTSIKCTQTIDKTNLKQYNAIFLPGGEGSNKFVLDTKLVDHLKIFNEDGRYLLAICAAPAVFSKLDLLGKHKVTCYPENSSEIGPNLDKSAKNVVVDGNFITAKAAGSVFEFAFKVIETLASKKEAEIVAKRIFYKL
ncbi:DJ-1/PfpI family protein [[Mycoplasma] testudinis]|uniref:DJ-1/PfpI family protein n=1 Tax=[Mycoplasma] testudinis TaxID=33924 RepID=UPI0006974967|nr:DJ-1/PfpI family protein [[Mycoplasma] testudinis]